MVVVDACSKYPEVVNMSNTTAIETVKVLRETFSRHGLPEMIVSDNGPQFTSDEFHKFCNMNGIYHRKSATYKPSTNGQAERIVQVLESAIAQAKMYTRGFRCCYLKIHVNMSYYFSNNSR